MRIGTRKRIIKRAPWALTAGQRVTEFQVNSAK